MGILKTAAGFSGNIGLVVLATGAEAVAQLADGWKWVREHEVLVGIPQANNDEHGGMDNVSLLYLHTNGSPVNHIPPRPTIEPALAEQETAQRIADYLNEGIDRATHGDKKAAFQAYSKAGMLGATAAQAKFGTGAPNAPITITGGWMRNHVSGKPVFIPGKGSSAPLIDTGALRKAVTYVVRKNGEDVTE